MSAALLRGFHQHLTEPSFDSEKCLLELRAPWDRKPSPAQLAAALEERTGEPITFVNPTEGDQGEPPWKLGELRHAESDWRAELLWDEAWTRFQCHDTTVSKRYFNEALWDALAGFGSPFAVKWRPLRPYRRMRMFDWARLQLERFWS